MIDVRQDLGCQYMDITLIKNERRKNNIEKDTERDVTLHRIIVEAKQLQTCTMDGDKNESGNSHLHCLELKGWFGAKWFWREQPGGDEPKIFYLKQIFH